MLIQNITNRFAKQMPTLLPTNVTMKICIKIQSDFFCLVVWVPFSLAQINTYRYWNVVLRTYARSAKMKFYSRSPCKYVACNSKMEQHSCKGGKHGDNHGWV